jgi:hypothetical protein
MDCVEMTTEGAAGSAARLGRAHLADGVDDQWLVTLNEPHLFHVAGEPVMRSQLMLLIVDLDALPSGGHPRRNGATHAISLALLAAEFRLGYLDDGVKPRVHRSVLGYAEVDLPGRPGARAAGRIVAACLAAGHVVAGSTGGARVAFAAAASAAAYAANMMTIVSLEA